MGMKGKFYVSFATVLAAIVMCAAFCTFFAPAVCLADSALNLRIGTYVVTGGDYIVWDGVPSADSYEILVDGKSAAVFPSPQEVRIDTLVTAAGNYVLTVRATSGGTKLVSESVAYLKTAQLAAPDELTYSDKMLTWLAVSGADYYSVTLNEVPVGTTQDPWFDLTNLLLITYDFTAVVTACSDSEYLLPSEPSSVFFHYTAPPFPIWHIEIAHIAHTYVASWPHAQGPPDGYGVKIYAGETKVADYYIDHNYTDIGEYVTGDGTYRVEVVAVKDGLSSAPFSKSFAIEDGEVTVL